ncbi:TetR family transcriptional regulator [Lactobacillus sp. S2-2]|uniref:TetR/AcrR family transcriptional regulator n=1 Tax=Lactobacillus sp. S2-2 TaxID=2692917 RepID=UPI001F286FF6|nr:TetR/AcrR family transcriptional regulator [Lactobacillus sp. S2-2]MCF6514673.1 TetR family transcriptional regulator [Lactobacillus sp. S2-2]
MSDTNNSEQLIIDGLFDLMIETPYTEISVKSICEKSGVSRMTFYRHFHTKEDVVIEQIAQVFRTFVDSVATDKSITFDQLASTFFNIIKDHKDMLMIILNNDLSNLLLRQLKNYMTMLVNDKILELRENSSKLLIALISGGLTEILIVWAEDDMQIPVEELVIFAMKYMHFKIN